MSLPWSMSALRNLGNCIRDELPLPESLPDYSEVMLWYTDLAAMVQQKIAGEDWSSILRGGSYEVTSRPKTIDTLREKLRRDRSTPLPRIQDVAGVRFEAEMTLDQQDLVAARIVELFDHEPARSIHDLRKSPHSGYRAVHIWLSLDGSMHERLAGRVEVQVRTHLQGGWANTYESAADLIGRGIRYGDQPSDADQARVVAALQDLSISNISTLESMRNQIEQMEVGIDSARRVLQQIRSAPDYLQDPQHEKTWTTTTDSMDRVKVLKQQALRGEEALKTALATLQDVFVQQRATKAG
jgi:ppGpp synthetase/RelA/SpoT-type nucleotidyltranferase